MSAQLEFLLHQAINYLEIGNLKSSELLFSQILKKYPSHSDSLRFLAVIAAHNKDYELALNLIEKSLLGNRKNAVAWSNKGNILLALGLQIEAIDAQMMSIKLAPNYSEAYSNLGNALQVNNDYQKAIDSHLHAIKLDGNRSDFIVNLGNAYARINDYEKAAESFSQAISIDPNNANAHFYLSLSQLCLGKFQLGWSEYEWRWLTKEFDSKPINSTRPVWDGQPFNGRLLIWAEQGIGDQILYSSILQDLRNLSQQIIVAVDKKLIEIYSRSFTEFIFLDKTLNISEGNYDKHISIGSLGKFFRKTEDQFQLNKNKYLHSNSSLKDLIGLKKISCEKKICGISWKSSNKNLGMLKSMNLIELAEILKRLPNYEFINLQYGDVSSEINSVQEVCDIKIREFENVNLYDDLDLALALVDACDIVITTSNTTAHMAGALGKEVLLLLPFSVGRFFYWHEVNGSCLWYPSISIFKQEKQGDWSKPIEAARAYLESRFAI